MPQFGTCAMAGGIMTKHLKAAVLCFGLAMLSGPISAAQQKKPTHPAPIPAQILTAKKVFIANCGARGRGPREELARIFGEGFERKRRVGKPDKSSKAA